MTPKFIYTHPSEDHVLPEVVWSGTTHGDVKLGNVIRPGGKLVAVYADDYVLEQLDEIDLGRPELQRMRRRLAIERNEVAHCHFREECDENPPRYAERLLDFIPLKYREHLIGDLEELYRKRLREDGFQVAQRFYWKQVLISLVTMIWTVIEKVAGLAVLLKLIK